MAGKSKKEDQEGRLAERLADLLVARLKDKSAEEHAPIWLNTAQAAERAQVANRTIYAAVSAKKLRAARVGEGRSLRFRAEWIDQWLDESAPKEIQ